MKLGEAAGAAAGGFATGVIRVAGFCLAFLFLVLALQYVGGNDRANGRLERRTSSGSYVAVED